VGRFASAVLAAAVAVIVPAATFAAPADPFADCRRALRDRPDDYESSYCFYQAALAGRLWDTAPPVLRRLMSEQPANYWLPLTLGHVYRGRDAARAEASYRRAAEGFHARGHDEGEVIARISLRDMLFPLGRTADAGREIEQVMAIAAQSRDRMLEARAWTAQATQLQDTGGDLGLSYGLLKDAERVVFPAGPYRLKRTLLSALGSVAFRLGRLDEALTTFEALDALAASANEPRLRANAQYNILNTIATKEAWLPSAGAAARLRALADRSLATAIEAHSDDLAAKAHRALAELLAAEPGTRAAALDHARQCGVLASRLRLPHDQAMCAWVEARLAGRHDAAARAAAERRAAEATVRAHSPRTDAFSAGRRMRLRWETAPAVEAVRDGLAALETIERLRDLQDEATSSAELFSAWTIDYSWLAGRLLEREQDDGLALAFSIAERLRARSLLEQLRTSRPVRNRARQAAAAEFDAIAAIQRRLLNPALAADERSRRLSDLDALERQAREARRQASVASGRSHAAAGPLAGIDAVQAALADDQALLSFQVGLWKTYDGQFGGGSWLVALTRRGRAVFRIPDRAELAGLVPLYAGLLSRDDGLDAAASARLHQVLLGPALRWLPPGVTRLVLVPDGVLHDLPFDALRDQEGPPLAARFEIVTAPSATLWRRWQRDSNVATPTRALALADPALGGATDGPASRRNAALYQGLRLGQLPFARREADAVARYWGGVDVLDGAAASERAVKTLDLRGYGLLHVAAHAVADSARPERSAVLLTPGDAREDGLLQSREIEQLDLSGGIVVLSACQSAAGVVQRGEGVLSLARAFFTAGAHAVIGSRWPIRDDEAAWFFGAFYRHLGTGVSLAAALRLAKRDAIAAGRPARAWAGVVLLGSGDLRPQPLHPPAASAPRPTLLVLVIVAMAMLWALRWQRLAGAPSGA